MKELGDQSVQLHNQMILSLSPDVLDTVIFYGEDICGIGPTSQSNVPNRSCLLLKKTAEETSLKLCLSRSRKVLGAHDQILLKGPTL